MIEEIEVIKKESVQDKRYLGMLKRRGKLELKALTFKASFGTETENQFQRKSAERARYS